MREKKRTSQVLRKPVVSEEVGEKKEHRDLRTGPRVWQLRRDDPGKWKMHEV